MPLIRLIASLSAGLAFASGTHAAPLIYDLDPSHTYPSFEADHMGGLSTWRGKFNKTAGTIVLDRQARSGTIEATVDIASVDFGHDEMNQHAVAPDMLDTKKFPKAIFKGTFTKFDGDKPEEASGDLALHGVTRKVTLDIDDFKCIQHPMENREACGANVSTTFNRGDFGVDFALDMGFKPEVKLLIQVEALRRR